MVGGAAWSGNGEDIPPGEWEATKIIGEEVDNGKKYYMVVWKPTLEPEENLGHMRELIADWNAKVWARREKRFLSFEPLCGGSSRTGALEPERANGLRMPPLDEQPAPASKHATSNKIIRRSDAT